MNLRNVNIYVTLLSITVSLFYSTVNPAIADDTNQPAVDRPNVLFIFSDDHAVNAISSYGGPLAKAAPTPNIDRLASEGALFQNLSLIHI